MRSIARRFTGLGAATFLVAGACSIEVLPNSDSAAPRAEVATHDSAAGTVVDTAPRAPAPDSASTTPPPPLASTPAPANGDTSAVSASAAELAELAATLVVPVQGVAPGELRDSYDEPRAGHVHQALDIHAPRGTPVVAATDGRVLKLHESVAGGLMVYQADASDRFILMYGHLDRWAPGLADGMRVKRGQVIGYVGTTGNAPPGTPHLHFVVSRGRPSVSWWRGTPVNPYPLLAR